MGAPQYEQAGADIGGTGTTNTIPRWTGPSTLGDSGLIDNGTAIYTTTRNVGIGTASPVAGGLTVYGASNGQVFVQNSSGYTRLLQNSTDFYIDGNVSGSAGNIIFRRGSGTLESARIDSAGNFSIGYTGGSWSSTYTGMFLNRGLSFMARDGGDAYLSANAIYDSSNAWKYVASGSTASTQIALQSGATVFSRAVAGTSGSALTWLESARIDSSGNVGIGTASPWSKLSAVTANGADTVSVGFSFDSANNYRSGISTNWSSVSASGNLMGFLVSNATLTGFTRVMTLNGAGQAAIGTSSFTTGRALTTVADLDVYGVRVGRGAGDQATNTAVGASALNANTSGTNNTALGVSALNANTSGSTNTGIGLQALLNNTSGSSNVAVGPFALGNTNGGSSNIALGREATTAAAGDSNQLVLGSATYYVATNGGATTYYATAGASLGYIQVRLNGANVKIQVFAP